MKDSIEDIYPLSPTQQGILFHTLLDEGTAVYFVQLQCTITGPLDVDAFKAAWQRVVDRHTILRTAFVWEGLKEPMQFVQREAHLEWIEQDWRQLAAEEQRERLRDFLLRDKERGFELTRVPLMRLALLRLGGEVFQFVWSHHHLLLDGWSGAQLLQEVFAFYRALRDGASPELEPSRPFGDYIEWLQQLDQSLAENFWRRMLEGVTSPTPLGFGDAPTVAHAQARHHGRLEVTLPGTMTASLNALARHHRLTLNTLIQGAWALLLSRYSGEETVLFGATVSGRPATLPGVETMLGIFINTLPVRVQVNPRAQLTSWLSEIQTMQAEMRQYEHTPLVQIQRLSEVPGGLPLFESVLVFENYPTEAASNAAAWKESVGLSLSGISWDDLINFPLAIGAEPGPDSGLTLRMVYDPGRFDEATIKRALGHLEQVLREFLIKPGEQLKALTLLTEAERRQVLYEWNDTRREYAPASSVPELFAAQVRRTPSSIAVCFEEQCLTYGELDSWTNRLAHRLRKCGVGPEARVGILMERSLEMVLAILGTLKAGGAYLPLDISSPRERLANMLEEAGPLVLLTQSRLASHLPETGAHVLCLDAGCDSIASESDEAVPCEVTAGNLAYVIYTSGSTGRPKGVMNTHEGILNRLLWMQEAFALTGADRVLQKTPYSFDVSVWEFLWPLLTGARLVVAPPDAHQDSSHLVRLIAEQQITILHFVPSMLRVFLEEKGLEACHSLRCVIASGEALPVELERRFEARLKAQLHNLYGPTEAAIDVTHWRCAGANAGLTVPIGRPIANTQIYLLDDMQPVPVGVTAELYIGGVNLARGYLGRADLTAERFIPKPFGAMPGQRLYRTGDLARFRPDGSIEFIGRVDTQVKLRGFRIELGEIERALSDHDAVREAVVLAREDTPGNQRLVAYLTLAPGATLDVQALRCFLREKLPEYMIPAAFMVMAAFPLTTSGKIDRRRLPPPDQERSTRSSAPFIEPRTPLEKELAEMWRELLGVSQVGVHDNFFELGGHSLMLTQLASRINEAFEVQLPLRVLFNVPSIVELTTAITAHQMEQADPDELAQVLDDLNGLQADEIQKLLEAENELTA